MQSLAGMVNRMILLLLLVFLQSVITTNILQDQGKALCSLLTTTNIASLRDQGRFVGWRCENHASGYLPYEDNKITVCGNRFLDCNSTIAGSSGCSDSFSNTTQLLGWTGVTCDESMFGTFGVKYLVTHLDLSSRSLAGSIDSQLGKISSLRVLDLSDNDLGGPTHPLINQFASNTHMVLERMRLEKNSFDSYLSSNIGSVVSLSSFGVFSNALTGSIPAQLALLTKLTKIELNNNRFDSMFPVSIFYMPEINSINLDTNKLTGLPVIAQQLTHLRTAIFSNNLITTPILQTGNWGNYMPAVRTLHLFNNKISGSISSGSFGGFVKVQDFQAHNNFISGKLPATVGQLLRLEILSLRDNQLTSSIPNDIGLCSNLQRIYLNSNSLSGSLTVEQLSPLARLVHLHLHKNALSSFLPVSAFDRMQSLKDLYLQENKFTGDWPDFGNLFSLENFDASYNTFSEDLRLPASLFGVKCAALRNFKCVSCNIHGEIPDQLPSDSSLPGTGAFGNLENLYIFDVSGNHLNSTIPQSINRIYGLYSVSLSSNALTGPIPNALFTTQVNYCFLQNNLLTGNLPGSSSNYLRLLNVQGNKLIGSLPPAIFGSRLQHLIVADNVISGTLPNILPNSPLITLDCSRNQISGAIPSGIASTAFNNKFTSISLSRNLLRGTIPFGIFNNPWLQSLDLSGNALEVSADGLDDAIRGGSSNPIGSLGNTNYYQFITNLRLNDNLIKYGLPRKIRHMYNLESLFLSSNAFGSTIPSSWSSLSKLTALHLSGNGLTGTIPASIIANNGGLATINLANNSFLGNMADILSTPSNSLIFNLRSLELSQNLLTGDSTQLSSSIGLLSRLTTLRIGKQNFLSNSAILNQIGWLASISTAMPSLKVLDISGLGLHGPIPSAFTTGLASLTYLDISLNAFTGVIPASVDALDALQVFDFHANALSGILPRELCSMNSATSIVAFPGNLNVACYYPCLISLLQGITTNAASVATCSTSVPTGQPSRQPTGQPSRQPTGQPSGQPTTAPTHTHYDGEITGLIGKIALNSTMVQLHAVATQNLIDRQCTGEIDIRETTLTYAGSSTTSVAEVWCIEQLNHDVFRHFGVEQELARDMARKNVAGVSPLLDLSKLRSLVYRGKTNKVQVSSNNSDNIFISAAKPAYRSGACSENGSGVGCVSKFIPFTPAYSNESLWEDTIVACPYFGKQSFSSSKMLPIARAESWPYGTSAMLQKIRLMSGVSTAVNNAGTTAADIDSRVAALFRTGTSALVGAYLTQKGSAFGGWDRVKVISAKRGWSEETVFCDSSLSGTATFITGADDDLGEDFRFHYYQSLASSGHVSVARASAITSGTIASENVTITHNTLAWSTVDVTEIVRDQIHFWYLHAPEEPLHINLLLTTDNASSDRKFGRTHYHMRAQGDTLGDFDLIVNGTRGHTEWFTSESNDPPLLQLFFQ